MTLRLAAPAYKRPEYVQAFLASAASGAEWPVPTYIFDDGTPGDSIKDACSEYGVEYGRSEANAGPGRALAACLRWAASNDDSPVVLLCATDHRLPKGWDACVVAAAAATNGEYELGMIDHAPGPAWYAELRAGAEPLWPGVGISRAVISTYSACSMPSIISGRAAMLALADHLVTSEEFAELPKARRVQARFSTFWHRRTGKWDGSFYTVVGEGCVIEHVGHHEGAHPGFMRTPEHEAYYREVGRTE